jgi:hypothetical protein
MQDSLSRPNLEFGFLKSFTSFLLAARTEATRMFSTIQPGERLNDSSTGLEGERLAWAHKSRSFCSSSSDTLPEKTITWGVCSSLKTPTRHFTSQVPRLGFQQRP